MSRTTNWSVRALVTIWLSTLLNAPERESFLHHDFDFLLGHRGFIGWFETDHTKTHRLRPPNFTNGPAMIEAGAWAAITIEIVPGC